MTEAEIKELIACHESLATLNSAIGHDRAIVHRQTASALKLLLEERNLIQPTALPAETQCDQLHADYKALQDVYDRDCVVPALRARIAELETALERAGTMLVAAAHDVEFHGQAKLAAMIREEADKARAVLASPQREGDRPVSPPDGRSRETKKEVPQ